MIHLAALRPNDRFDDCASPIFLFIQVRPSDLVGYTRTAREDAREAV